jgi:PncC family amidohydrolase
LKIAVAESVTAGHLAALLCTGDRASEWFLGGVVAYSAHAKAVFLNVPDGPLITPECAETMAREIASRLDADVAVATTGVAGPDPVEGRRPGTVWFGYTAQGNSGALSATFDGDPEAVLAAALMHSLTVLRQRLTTLANPSTASPVQR